jgi:hypothetical protein
MPETAPPWVLASEGSAPVKELPWVYAGVTAAIASLSRRLAIEFHPAGTYARASYARVRCARNCAALNPNSHGLESRYNPLGPEAFRA